MADSSSPDSRIDGWISAVTGLGTRQDKRTSYAFVRGVILDPETCEALYDENDLAAWICDAYPEESLREGILLEIPDDKELSARVLDRLEELDALQLLTDAMVNAAVTGAGALFIGVEGDQATPLELDTITEIRWLKAVSRRDLTANTYYKDPDNAKHGQPETYTIVPVRGGFVLDNDKRTVVHETRFIWFEGVRTSPRSKLRNGGWAFSKLQRLLPVIRNFDISWEGTSYMMQDANQAVFKLHGLLNALASQDGAVLLERRLATIERTRGITNAIAVDPEKGEDFLKIATSFTGVPEILDRFADRLAAASRIPVTVLVGSSPAGLNATGQSDIQLWYDRVRVFQKQEVKPACEVLVQAVLSELGARPESFTISFPELERMNPQQEAQLRNLQAQTDKLMIDSEVVTPEEIAVSRYSIKGWTPETQINLEVREAVLNSPTEEQPDSGDAGTIGARAGAITDLLDKVARNEMPVESARAILISVFGMTPDVAEEVIGDIGTKFKIEPKPVPEALRVNAEIPNPTNPSPVPPAPRKASARAKSNTPPPNPPKSR